MATITLSFIVSAADQTRMVSAFQVEANADVGGTANQAQVLTYIKKYVRIALVTKVQAYEAQVDLAALPVHVPVDLT